MMAAILGICRLFLLVLPMISPASQTGTDSGLPTFGRDTVLVYRSSVAKEGPLTIRIATFLPDRYVEWEDTTAQGTIFLPAKVVSAARALVNYQLFQAGVDTRGKDATTLWLSERLFREVKAGKKIKFMIDGLTTSVMILGEGTFDIEVNRSARTLPVIRTKDERGAERWFLDSGENPLLVNLMVRDYQQKLASITTDRPHTLRWIKDRKK